MPGPALGTIMPAGAAPLAKDPRLSDIPLNSSSPHLIEEEYTGNIHGALTFPAEVKQALTTYSAGNRTCRGPLK